MEGVLFVDGPSDKGLARPLEWLCAEAGLKVNVRVIDPLLERASLRSVGDRIAWAANEQIFPQLMFIHRDAENESHQARADEIARAVKKANVAYPVVPVIPVRMTEAWLLLDESAIRSVAGRPGGSTPLRLPKLREVERLSDPKDRLDEALVTASGCSGRRLLTFRRDLAQHRERLLERLDPTGRVSQLTSWNQLKADIRSVAHNL